MIPQHTEYVKITERGFYPSMGLKPDNYSDNKIAFCSLWGQKEIQCDSVFYTNSVVVDVVMNAIGVVYTFGTLAISSGFVTFKSFDKQEFNKFVTQNNLKKYQEQFIVAYNKEKFEKKSQEIAKNSKSQTNTKANDFYIILDATNSMNLKDSDGSDKFNKAKQNIYDITYKIDSDKTNLALIVCSDTCQIYVYPTSNFGYIREILDLITPNGNANINDSFKLFKAKKGESMFLLVGDKDIDMGVLAKFKNKSSVYTINYGTTSDQSKEYEKYGYSYYKSNNSVKISDEITKLMERTKLIKSEWKGGDYTFRVNFDFNDDKIKDEYIGVVKDFANYLKSNYYTIFIEGHTDDVGDESYNKDLSLKRAISIKNALVNFGIDDSRIYPVGYGKNVPMVANTDEQSRAMNRRVEAKIGKDGYYDIDLVNKNNKSKNINIAKADIANLYGYFLITDKNRTYEQYHAVFVLYPNNKIYYAEIFLNDKLTSNEAYWEFNPKNSEFLFDATNRGEYPSNGVVKGKIIGNINAFDMDGKWSDSSVANTKFFRISKDEFLCVLDKKQGCFN